MEYTSLRSFTSACENSSRAKLRELIMLFLQSHILFWEFRFSFAETTCYTISLNKFTKKLIFYHVLEFVSMITIDKARHGWVVPMDVHIHKQSRIALLIKLGKLCLFVVFVLIIIDNQFNCSDRWTNLRGMYVFSIEDCP